jgi:hypothetical protein
MTGSEVGGRETAAGLAVVERAISRGAFRLTGEGSSLRVVVALASSRRLSVDLVLVGGGLWRVKRKERGANMMSWETLWDLGSRAGFGAERACSLLPYEKARVSKHTTTPLAVVRNGKPQAFYWYSLDLVRSVMTMQVQNGLRCPYRKVTRPIDSSSERRSVE